ncbi:dihydrodipicolinate synthase family protein [Caldanaerobacter subterraneus]|uniref:dihydrodipicolinate synthase family protein n=1 Tax=Caldanaerobacter subterraneus TaxID=911092 RepID=UPI00175BA8F2|nr:dihydrodipicolinate synthase family protein [Clostridia bacterium]
MDNRMLLPPEIYKLLQEGTVIPAHPLALTEERKLDEKRQRALTRYYIAAGAGGIAVGVHTTQFEIRQHNLYEKVLEIAAEEVEKANLKRPFIKVAGIIGPTEQALKEAEIAVKYGYHLGLLSMGGLDDWNEEDLIKRTEEVGKVIPVFGFYLQPAAGGRKFSYNFWRWFVDIPYVMAIKIAPFNRYYTLDVVRAVCESDRRDEIALYTGNDDNIVIDLLTKYRFNINGKIVEKRIAGGLLGHWAVWTKKAVELFEEIKKVREKDTIPSELLTKAIEITDCNAAFFDASNNFHGVIAGIHEVLRRQGLMQGTWCLNPEEDLSPGQKEEIDRVYKAYPHLNDDDFVREHIEEWLS